jgi:hypothetical protein
VVDRAVLQCESKNARQKAAGIVVVRLLIVREGARPPHVGLRNDSTSFEPGGGQRFLCLQALQAFVDERCSRIDVGPRVCSSGDIILATLTALRQYPKSAIYRRHAETHKQYHVYRLEVSRLVQLAKVAGRSISKVVRKRRTEPLDVGLHGLSEMR